MNEIKITIWNEQKHSIAPVDFDLTAGHTPKIIGANYVYADFIKLPPRCDYSVRVEIPGCDQLAFWCGEKLMVSDEGVTIFDFFMPDDLFNTAAHVNLLQVKYQSRPQVTDTRGAIDWTKPILPGKPLVIVHSFRFVPQVRYQMGDISKILRVS